MGEELNSMELPKEIDLLDKIILEEEKKEKVVLEIEIQETHLLC